MIKRKWIKWAGHAARMGKNLGEKPEGKNTMKGQT
jgi:hypothetical protein